MSWSEQLRQQALEQGVEQGIEQGIARARQEQRGRERVLRMLHLKFGAVPDTAAQTIATARLDALERWTERILVAPAIEEVFAADT
ncbi:MAG: flagellar biosynthesis/type III secretory pathway protein FliH [Myxococcota bacterium]|jgi:flagellar biosynthesis/type III secretory pathway protein FliH